MNRRIFLKQAMAVFGIALVTPTELLPVVKASVDRTNPLFTGAIGEFNGGCFLYSDIEAAKKSLQDNEIKPIKIKGEEYYMMFAHGNSYKIKA